MQMTSLFYQSQRYFSKEVPRNEIGTYSLSRGTVGRKIFRKGWSHLEPRKPINIQERWHRASVERLFHPRIIENVETITMGNEGTHDWRMFFQSKALDLSKTLKSKPELNDLKKLSPWHDIPVGFYTNQNQLLFNYINEIPKGDRAKMESAVGEEWNPIKQDIKKGNLRFFKYGDIPFNYGFIPQTWEDPKEESSHVDIQGLGGDNDPVDVVEISNEKLPRGQIIPIKVLSVLGLIDEGETDWKIIGIRANHPLASKLNTIQDVRKLLNHRMNIDEIIVDWFRNYKVPDGKPQNAFSHNAQYQSPEKAVYIIEETHRQWYNLMLGAREEPKCKLTSVTQMHLIAQGLTSNKKLDVLPKIDYPKYEDWTPRGSITIEDPDKAKEQYELNEEAPDQQRKF